MGCEDSEWTPAHGFPPRFDPLSQTVLSTGEKTGG